MNEKWNKISYAYLTKKLPEYENDRERVWANEVWNKCDFCDKYFSEMDECDFCPLYPKHCYTIIEVCVEKGNTMGLLYEAWINKAPLCYEKLRKEFLEVLDEYESGPAEVGV